MKKPRKSKIPCGGYWINNTEGCDFSCDYEGAGRITCEECTINGGDYSPITGKRSRNRNRPEPK